MTIPMFINILANQPHPPPFIPPSSPLVCALLPSLLVPNSIYRCNGHIFFTLFLPTIVLVQKFKKLFIRANKYIIKLINNNCHEVAKTKPTFTLPRQNICNDEKKSSYL
jgi:hypothetical protein